MRLLLAGFALFLCTGWSPTFSVESNGGMRGGLDDTKLTMSIPFSFDEHHGLTLGEETDHKPREHVPVVTPFNPNRPTPMHGLHRK
ncbi:MAG: hypothetical protein EOP83_24620 [Verrucomicrobiaceae bacterium]|nr:MAG: hypothetical protein EOP83_24620 [Verrucomicrobiaceae bacterium]